MSIHKLTAGSGYDYLTRQVAALDATDKGHTGLASYYTAKGESPGVWVGTGMAGIDGLAAGDVVTAEQMQALFGSGHHPLAHERRDRLAGPDLTDRDYRAVTRLGQPYKVYAGDVSAYRLEVAQRIEALNEQRGHPVDYRVPAEDRARIRTQVAREFFAAEHGCEPTGAREIAATIAKHSRPKTTAVAGYDLTFSPVKSVSTLWAVADQQVAARIELAHQAAVKDALAFLEQHALFTREGTNGVRQVDVRGLVATAFTHRDSRAGDPDLHTHVAVANKVQTLGGKWLAIDGRVLFKATVAASETYNTALERHLRKDLGVRFADRENPDPRKRPVREIVGVDPRLNARWSARRASIETRRGQLAADFQRAHGRPPSPIESVRLAQQATLETRDAKHEPRSLGQQRASWSREAQEVLGSRDEVDSMVTTALGAGRDQQLDPDVEPVRAVDTAEVAQAVIGQLESRRSTWQTWHVRAEAQRQIRAANLSPALTDDLVDRVVEHATARLSQSLARPEDDIKEPARLRRRDGSSVYTVAGARLFTSARVLAAEQRLVAAAGRADGRAVEAAAVDMALLEAVANGASLNAGQAALVRAMATSGARLQLAIAPAGAGKTTAMRALAGAWSEDGGHVIGLAPSAAAAAALREQIQAGTDTLAKLTHSIATGDVPDWAAQIGPRTLVIIDEAGMADTLSLDTAVAYVLGRGGSVRLVGDDQQLAAIGAGGVLRDLQASHGACRLTELVRFADPAEAAATLALRDGRPEALGFYLDHHRVHVGDLATLTEDVFDSWQADRGHGLDSIMLAPTRELASQLNQRARAHRLDGLPDAQAMPTISLGDGNVASVGELVITRANDRRLRTTATDWVKNGDRWTVLSLADGAMTVQHARNGRVVTLPAGYVKKSTELGYATTTHAAQGVSVDTMHGLASGAESRQALYTMLTRGRHANHLYLQVVGDGDPHSVIRPEMTHPRTATDLLETILARDDAPRSATTLLREQHEPATLLGQAAPRYLDALHVAAEDLIGPQRVAGLEAAAEHIVPDLTDQPAWPALRAHLLLIAAHGTDPLPQLRAAASARELDTALDTAAVLDWRLDDSGLRGAGPGPLPWLPGIPAALREHTTWGPYLHQRAAKVTTLAEQVHAAASEPPPTWASPGAARPDPPVVGDLAVWRAATGVDPADRRPTGPAQLQKAAALWQRALDQRLSGRQAPAMDEWATPIAEASTAAARDPFAPVLADRLAAISRCGLDAPGLLRRSATAGPLPDDHAAAALWWRINRHLSPVVAAQINHDPTLATPWTPRLPDLLGEPRAEQLQASPSWPTLVAVVDHALARGWTLENLLPTQQSLDTGPGEDACQALIWRIAVLLGPVPDQYDHDDPDAATEQMWAELEISPESPETLVDGPDALRPSTPDVEAPASTGATDQESIEQQLWRAGLVRDGMGPLEPSDAEIEQMLDRAAEMDLSPVSPERIAAINAMTLAFYEACLPRSWGADHLNQRFGADLAGDPRFHPGFAPAGWTHLVGHLRRRGVSDQEMLAAGVASTARTGRLIDRFRDRVVLPIVHHGQVLGFVGRRHPDRTDQDQAGPRYLNTPDTVLFHKGAQLYAAGADLLATEARPVLVEGPMDAIAITVATAGTHVGVASLGTALTQEQAAQLASLRDDAGPAGHPSPRDRATAEYEPWLVVATDADPAGQIAAERDYWLLAQHGLDPARAQLPTGHDPADLLALRGPASLKEVLSQASPLADALLEERLANLPPDQARIAAARVVAARPSRFWTESATRIASRLQLSPATVQRDLLAAAQSWNADPRTAARAETDQVNDVRTRQQQPAHLSPQQRWASLASELDPQLPHEGDWPALAALLEQAHSNGHDISAVTRQLVAERSLDDRPAQDLRYRIVATLDLQVQTDSPVPPLSATRSNEERRAPSLAPRQSTGPRR